MSLSTPEKARSILMIELCYSMCRTLDDIRALVGDRDCEPLMRINDMAPDLFYNRGLLSGELMKESIDGKDLR